jgi:adenine-specific DNA-methyltransferase
MMKKLTADDPETCSAEVLAENVEHLKALFPEAFTEGSVDFEVLKQLLGGTVDEREEKYGLNWYGKRRARQLALTPSTGTLRPCPEDSVDWDTTQNLMIEGDNLEVLKLLQKNYAGKVKLIYIDPPYNTGSDFVYPDDFRDNIQNYLELTGQVEGGRKISSNTEASGRFHTDWLNMVYPRLKLARNLLSTGGIVFVSIDDTELAALRAVADEVFGPENFLACVVWKKRSSPDARTIIGTVHDYICCYARSGEFARSAISKMGLSEARKASYSNPDNDARGDWASVDMTGQTGRAPAGQYYNITLPSGRVISPPEGRAWGLALRTFDELRADNRIWFGNSGDNVPRIKRFLSESEGQVVPTFWDMADVGSNDEAKKEVNELMGRAEVFDTPKPVRLIERIIEIASSAGDLVMDFFAGSGTTAHALWTRTAKDRARRRFILVQLPEPLNSDVKTQKVGYELCLELGRPTNIAELTKERLRRAAKKIRDGNPMFAGDLGFRVFKLDSSNIHAWEPDRAHLATTLEESVEHLKTNRTEADILYELLLKLGVDLCVPIERKTIAGKTVHNVGGGVLLACLATQITRDEVEPLAQGIVVWRQVLAPAGDTTCVFRDSAFADDVTKTNMAAILSQHGLANVRSL